MTTCIMSQDQVQKAKIKIKGKFYKNEVWVMSDECALFCSFQMTFIHNTESVELHKILVSNTDATSPRVDGGPEQGKGKPHTDAQACS